MPYYFQKNLQGDIIGILDKNAAIVARYNYDAWGKIVSIKDGNNADISSDTTHIANINPFRYRGYYYDAEIDMYYLQSRYYDPEIGRFANSDEPVIVNNINGTLDINIISYCFNNVINKTDYYGLWPRKYKYTSSKDINCYSYALGLNYWRNVPIKKPYTASAVCNAVYKDLKKLKRNGYKLGYSYSFSMLYRMYKKYLDSYYFIALRVGNRYIPKIGNVNDYHFWVLHENGTWSHKPGSEPSEYIGSYLRYNPAFANWKIYYYLNGKKTFNYFYNSKTYYMLVSKYIIFS